MSRILTVGDSEAVLSANTERQAKAGYRIFGSDYSISLGGAGAVTAVTVSVFGHESIFCSNVGKDVLGKTFLAMLDNYSVSRDYITVDQRRRTGLLLSVSESGFDPAETVFRGSNSTITIDSIRSASNECPDGAILFSDLSPDIFSEAETEMNRQGATLIIDATDAQSTDNLYHISRCETIILTEETVSKFTTERFSSESGKLKICGDICKRLHAEKIIVIQKNGACFIYDDMHYYYSKSFGTISEPKLYEHSVFTGAYTSHYIRHRNILSATNFALAAMIAYKEVHGYTGAIPDTDKVKETLLSGE